MAEIYNRSSDEVLEAQEVDADSGLSDAEVKKRLEQHGENRLDEAQTRSTWRIFVDQFKSLIFAILFGAAALSFLFGEVIQGFAILVAIAINAAIGFFTELRATRSMEALRKMERVSARVLRDGEEQEIDAAELVPGDIVLLDAGEVVPADLRLVESGNLRLNESALTGESVPQGKTTDPLEGETEVTERENMAFKGTSVSNGSGRGVVTATGMKTELGRISRLAEEAEENQTPLEKRLDRLSRRLLVVRSVVIESAPLVSEFVGIVRPAAYLLHELVRDRSVYPGPLRLISSRAVPKTVDTLAPNSRSPASWTLAMGRVRRLGPERATRAESRRLFPAKVEHWWRDELHLVRTEEPARQTGKPDGRCPPARGQEAEFSAHESWPSRP